MKIDHATKLIQACYDATHHDEADGFINLFYDGYEFNADDVPLMLAAGYEVNVSYSIVSGWDIITIVKVSLAVDQEKWDIIFGRESEKNQTPA